MLRQIAGRRGWWVRVHGEWSRPLNVWRYRGAWRVICYPCMYPLASDDPTFDYGWPTMEAAFDAAHRHCATCIGSLLGLAVGQ